MRIGVAQPAILAFVMAVTAVARAQPLASETFSYPNGSSVEGQNGGTGFAQPWFVSSDFTSNPRPVVQGGVAQWNPAGPATVRQIAFRSLPFSFDVGSKIWMSFDLLAMADAGKWKGISLFDAPDLASERLFIGNATTVFHNSMRRGVVEFDIGGAGASVADLWVGTDLLIPVDINRPPDAIATGLTLNSTQYVAVNAAGNFSANNLYFGMHPEDVGGTVLIPEPASLALVVMFLPTMFGRRT